MDSTEPEEKCSNAKSGEETTASAKRRSKSRRVSFAETTAIHLFIRDEEYETPPEVEGSSNDRLHRSESDEIRDLLASDSDDSDKGGGGGGDDDDGNAVNSSFLVPVEFPSPGSYIDSATSNDEHKFFGPVSAEFIKPGRSLDSACSDENHDVTMDSTAFSMHFHSLAKLGSGGEFKTPTGVPLEFGDRTSGQVSTTRSGGGSMVLTTSGKRVAGSSLPAATVSYSGNSDDMSVVGENPHKYDYGELPPELDVLFAEDDKIVGAVSQTSNDEHSNTIFPHGSSLHQTGLKLLNLTNRDVDAHHVSGMVKTSNGAISSVQANFDDKSDSVPHATLGETTNVTSNMDDDRFPVILSDDPTNTPVVLLPNVMPFVKDEEVRKGSGKASGKFLSSPLSLQPNLSHEQSIAGSVSSFLGVHRQTSMGSLNVKSNLSVSKKKFSDKESKHVSSASSIEKCISRLKRLEVVSFASASKAESNASRLMPPEPLTSSLTRDSLLIRDNNTSKETPTKILAAPVVCLDTHFTKSAEDDVRSQSKRKLGGYDLRSLGDAQYVIHSEVKDAELLSPSDTLNPHDNSTKFTETSISPLALSKDISISPCRRSRDTHTMKSILSTMCEYSFSRDTEMPVNSTYPETSAVRKVSGSPLYQGSFSKSQNLQAESHLGLDPDVKQKLAENFASRYEITSPLLIERKEEAMWSTSDIEHSKFVNKEMQSDGSNVEKLDKVPKSFKVVVSSVNVDTGATSTSTLPVKNMNSVAKCAPTLEDNLKKVSKSSKEDLSHGLLQKKQCVTHRENVHCPVGNTVFTPRSSKLTSKHDENGQCLVKPSNVFASDSSLKRKLFNKDDDHDDEYVSFQHKPRLWKDEKNYEGTGKVPLRIGGDATERHWIDVFSSFCHKIKLLSSSLIDKLDLAQIRMLNDIMVYLDKMKSYELLHHGTSPQKSFDFASYRQIKRSDDTKLLLSRTAYQKGKLQSMYLEQEKLLDQVSQLDFRVEKSKMLISSCSDSCMRGLTDAQLACFSVNDPSKRSLVAVEILSKWKELEVVDRKIMNLNKSYDGHIKVPNVLACTDASVHVKNFLRKRVGCRSVQSECQPCQVRSVKVVDGKPNILFDHGGIMSQRFIVNSISTDGLIISNTFNSVKITKMFPGMDACTVFSFFFGDQGNLAYSGLWTIAQETQKTTSLLHSVLDVIEEVELAMLELRNLTNCSFSQPSAGNLDLQLSFTDLKFGATLSLTIDITCSNWGIYPSQAPQILPYEMQVRVGSRHESFQSLLDNIENVASGVSCRYMRLISLCRSVSKMIQPNCRT